MFCSRIIIATIVLSCIYIHNGVAGQNVTEGPELQPAPVLPGNDTTWFRPNPFGFFPNFQWPFTRIFRCRFVHRSHPLIPYRESGTELPESSSPTSEAPDSEGEGVTLIHAAGLIEPTTSLEDFADGDTTCPGFIVFHSGGGMNLTMFQCL